MLETTAIIATAFKRTEPASHRKADAIAWLADRLEWEDRLKELHDLHSVQRAQARTARRRRT